MESVGGARDVINGAFMDLIEDAPAASTDCIMKFEYIAPVCRFVIVAVQVVPVWVNEVTLVAPPATAADAVEAQLVPDGSSRPDTGVTGQAKVKLMLVTTTPSLAMELPYKVFAFNVLDENVNVPDDELLQVMLAGNIFNDNLAKVFAITTIFDIEGIPEDEVNANDAAPVVVNV